MDVAWVCKYVFLQLVINKSWTGTVDGSQKQTRELYFNYLKCPNKERTSVRTYFSTYNSSSLKHSSLLKYSCLSFASTICSYSLSSFISICRLQRRLSLESVISRLIIFFIFYCNLYFFYSIHWIYRTLLDCNLK